MNIQIYYPIIIFQGKVYGAYIANGELSLEEIEHVQFRKQSIIYGRKEPETYQIDVISEGYLPNYLKILENEFEMIKKYFRRKRHIVKNSIQRITDEARSLKERPISYRSVFEYKENA